MKSSIKDWALPIAGSTVIWGVVWGLTLSVAYCAGDFPVKTSTYSSSGTQPDSQQALQLIGRCLKMAHYADADFRSSWKIKRFMNTDRGYLYCDIEEIIDYRERSKLEPWSENPPKSYSWKKEVVL